MNRRTLLASLATAIVGRKVMADEKGTLTDITSTSNLAVSLPNTLYTCPRCGAKHSGMGHSWMIQNNEKGYRAEFCAVDIADAAVAILKERGVPVTITQLETKP